MSSNGNNKTELFELPHSPCRLVKEHDKKIDAINENIESIVVNIEKQTNKINFIIDEIKDGFKRQEVNMVQMANFIEENTKLLKLLLADRQLSDADDSLENETK